MIMTQEIEGCGKAELSPDLNPAVLMWKELKRAGQVFKKDLQWVKNYLFMQVSVYGNENWVNVIKNAIHIYNFFELKYILTGA